MSENCLSDRLMQIVNAKDIQDLQQKLKGMVDPQSRKYAQKLRLLKKLNDRVKPPEKRKNARFSSK